MAELFKKNCSVTFQTPCITLVTRYTAVQIKQLCTHLREEFLLPGQKPCSHVSEEESEQVEDEIFIITDEETEKSESVEEINEGGLAAQPQEEGTVVIVFRGVIYSEFTSRARVFKGQRPRALEVNFEFPPVAVRILVVLQYVVADIILYSKNLSSVETVTLWLRTSSQCDTLVGKPSKTFPIHRIFHSFKVGIK